MKKCPYCREDIQDDAIKCHFCLSALPPKPDTDGLTAVQITGRDRIVYSFDRSLVRSIKFMSVIVVVLVMFSVLVYLYGFDSPQSGPKPDQVTYVLDQGLIRFTKVAGVVLAMFVTVGVFLYGFNLKEAAKEIRDTGDRVREVHRSALQTADEVGTSRDAVSADRVESENLLREMHGSRDSILAEVESLKGAVEALLRRGQDSVQKLDADVEELKAQVAELIREGKSSIQDFESKTAVLLAKTEDGTAESNNDATGEADPLKSVRGSVNKVSEELLDGKKESVASGDSSGAVMEQTGSSDGRKKKRKPPKSSSFAVPELTQLYEFPTEFDGSGQCIGLIELGGGYRSSDLEKYFSGLGLKTPNVTLNSIDGAVNQPSSEGGADYQVTMDIEVAGAVAPGAHIVVYMAPNTDEGFLNAVQSAISDEINRPSIVSIGWGVPEVNWTATAMAKLNDLFELAAKRNITVICPAGDNGVTDGVQDGKPHVDFPASSPWVLACGGTHLTRSDQPGFSEVVWNSGDSGTGGGISNVFDSPAWQSAVELPIGERGVRGRGVPDVAANASPYSGYHLRVRGQELVLGGTSAAAPLWAGLIARINQGLGRNVGFFNPVLYSTLGPAGSFRDITDGDNTMHGVQGFTARPGWDLCTGWGSPNGVKLLDAFRKSLT